MSGLGIRLCHSTVLAAFLSAARRCREGAMKNLRESRADIGTSGRLLLRWFCRKPGTEDYPMQGVHYLPGHELDKLLAVFPDLRNQIAGKNVVDFACGWGYQCIALARAGAKHVLGTEINESAIDAANRLVAHHKLAGQVSIMREIPPDFRADIIVSRNGFEHFLEPDRILLQMQSALSPCGKIFIAFAPPWNAPWGAHMAYFCRLPWVHLVFSEKTVMDVRRVFRPGTERTYREVGLAQMSLAKFERIIRESGLSVQYCRYDCVHRMNWLSRTPLRELFVNRVSCILMCDSPGIDPCLGVSIAGKTQKSLRRSVPCD